jgi:cyclase
VPQQVSARVYVETGRLGSNTGIVVGAAGRLVLIDAPHKPTDAQRWADEVAAFGRVAYLVHTDHHPDHVVGNAWLGGIVVAHHGTRRRLRDEPLGRDYLTRLFDVIDPPAVADERAYTPRLPEVTFDRRLTLHLEDLNVELHHVPGHTANTIAGVVPEEGVIFTGDNVCPAGLPSFQDSTVASWFDALDYLETFEFEHLVGGHGEVTGPEAIALYREEGRAVIGQIAQGMEQGKSRDELVATVRFPDRLHTSTAHYVGYPDHLVEVFQRRSVERIFDDLSADWSLAAR